MDGLRACEVSLVSYGTSTTGLEVNLRVKVIIMYFPAMMLESKWLLWHQILLLPESRVDWYCHYRPFLPFIESLALGSGISATETGAGEGLRFGRTEVVCRCWGC